VPVAICTDVLLLCTIYEIIFEVAHFVPASAVLLFVGRFHSIIIVGVGAGRAYGTAGGTEHQQGGTKQ